jgi:hypothetical protein
MFKLSLYDSFGNKLKQGDIVQVLTGRPETLTFYAEVKYLKDENIITPFHTFSFHSFKKVNKLPDNVKKSTEKRYNIWFEYHDVKKIETAEKYLIDWRKCEHLLKNRCFRIELIS